MDYKLSAKEISIIEKHYKKYFTLAGAKDSEIVMHDIINDDMHIDIEHYLPTQNFPYHIFATIGMSGYTMKDAPYKNIELIMFLPKDWKTEEDADNEEWSWPINMLKSAARLPYLFDTFLSVGHTFSMDENNSPFANSTTMSSGLVTFPSWLDYGIFELKYGGFFNKKIVNFLCLTAITNDELNLKNEIGTQKFLDEILIKDGQDDLLVRNER